MNIDPQAVSQLQIAQMNLNSAIASLTTPISPSDNFLSILETSPANSIFSLDPLCNFQSPGLVISKPCIIHGPISVGRVSPTAVLPILSGDITVTAPNVSLSSLRLNGIDSNKTILVTGNYTLVDRCVIHGSPLGQHRGIEANSNNVTIQFSYIDNIWAQIDAQAIAGWLGFSGLKIVDCYLEASGENVIFGGADTTMNPSNISISNCLFNKPIAWKGNPALTVKNLLELKNAQNVVVDNCHLMNCWVNGQDGYGLVMTVRNQNGNSPQSNVSGVTISNCSFLGLDAGINILGSDDTYPSEQMNNVSVQNCSFSGITGRQIMIGGGPQNLSFFNNIFTGTKEISAITFSGTKPKNPLFTNICKGLAITNNTFDEGDYGIVGDGAPSLGVGALNMYAPGYAWISNTIHRGSSGRNIIYPPGTIVV